jgi:hypothetical protein
MLNPFDTRKCKKLLSNGPLEDYYDLGRMHVFPIP